MESAALIDWRSDESVVLLNPRMPEYERRPLERLVTNLPAHVWLATSGTGGTFKLAGLSKQAFLISADAVNRRLDAEQHDVWCCPLPTFHVGGLAIYARAFLTGSRVVRLSWDPRRFANVTGVTLASLVPAQVSDLVEERLTPRGELRAVVVGGGALAPRLYSEARALGWPLLPSYGMTECCSQVATARPESPDLVLLDHVAARVEEDGRLALRSDALLTGYATDRGIEDPKVSGWFVTEDLASLDGSRLRVLGRRGDVVKVGGEHVDLERLDQILGEIGADGAVYPIPDARLGTVIGLAIASGEPASIEAEFNSRVFPFERPQRVVLISRIPRTELGKVIRSQVTALAGGGSPGAE